MILQMVKAARTLIGASANVDLTDGEGSTPFIWVSNNGRIECVNTLIGASANVDLTDDEGSTPFIWASKNGRIECVNTLIGASQTLISQIVKAARLLSGPRRTGALSVSTR